MSDKTTVHTFGGAEITTHYCEAGPHSFVAVTADYGHIAVTREGVGVEIAGPVALHISPANARKLAADILAALPVAQAEAA